MLSRVCVFLYSLGPRSTLNGLSTERTMTGHDANVEAISSMHVTVGEDMPCLKRGCPPIGRQVLAIPTIAGDNCAIYCKESI